MNLIYNTFGNNTEMLNIGKNQIFICRLHISFSQVYNMGMFLLHFQYVRYKCSILLLFYITVVRLPV
jgi:hypothetical protein